MIDPTQYIVLHRSLAKYAGNALQCKNERLERIVEKGRVSKSGAAVHLAKIAEGVA